MFIIWGHSHVDADIGQLDHVEPSTFVTINYVPFAIFIRSKQRFYVVGDKKLLGELRYFREAAAALPTVLPSEFISYSGGL